MLSSGIGDPNPRQSFQPLLGAVCTMRHNAPSAATTLSPGAKHTDTTKSTVTRGPRRRAPPRAGRCAMRPPPRGVGTGISWAAA